MFASLVISFREIFEITLIVGVVLRCLVKNDHARYVRFVYKGALAGVILSVVGAVLFTKLAGGFVGQAKEVFQAATLVVGALLLTTMILWMRRERGGVQQLQSKALAKIEKEEGWGLFLLVAVSVLREGIELVLYLAATNTFGASNGLIGALAGTVAACAVGYLVFIGSKKLPVQKFFAITSVVLLIFAGGLLARSVHALEEAKILPHYSLVQERERVEEISFQTEAKEGEEEVEEFLEETIGLTGVPTAAQVGVLIAYTVGVTYWYRKTA